MALLPILTAIGCAIDYSIAARMNAKLQAAADEASVASVALKSPGFTAATTMSGNGTVAAGVTDASNVFNANISGITGYNNLSEVATVIKSGTALTSTVTFSAKVPVTFMQLLGYQSMTVTGKSVSTATLPTYLDFYLMLDVSASMGLASTTGEQSRLAAVNQDFNWADPTGCTFACHYYGYEGYTLSRDGGNSNNTPVTSCPTAGTSACIQIRLDVVGNAVNQLLATANAAAVVSNQYRIGLYPFIDDLYAYFPLTSAISGSPTNPSTINYAAANLANILDTGSDPNMGAGGTHYENAFPDINNLITSVGNGSSWNNTLPFIILITDGTQDNQLYTNWTFSGSNQATTLDPTLCTSIKNRGIVIAVVYVPYLPIPNPTNAFNDEMIYANNNIPNIPAPLQSCASPNYYFTADSQTDLSNALNTIFAEAVGGARISQ